MDSFEKFNQTELPAEEHFYSILNDQHITNDEYDHAKKFGRLLKLKQWVNTMTYTLEVMCSCWLMYLKALERPAYNTIRSVPAITSPPPACHGTPCKK